MRLALVPLIVTAACALGSDTDLPATLEKLAESPSRVVLYALAPRHDEAIPLDQTFHLYPIRGRADVTDPNERRALLQALARGARDATPNTMAACFNPRHGLRVEQGSYAADFVICCECLQVQSCGFRLTDDFLTSAEPQRIFDESLRRHNLPLPQK